MPRRRGSSTGNLPRFAPGRQKITGRPSSLPRKATFKSEPQHRQKPVLNRATEQYRLASLQVMYSLGIQKSIVASSRGSLFTWLETVGVILATHKV